MDRGQGLDLFEGSVEFFEKSLVIGNEMIVNDIKDYTQYPSKYYTTIYLRVPNIPL